MARASLDELRFFLDGREQLADRVAAIGASITDVMKAIAVEEIPELAPASDRIYEVCVLLEDGEYEELSVDEIQFL